MPPLGVGALRRKVPALPASAPCSTATAVDIESGDMTHSRTTRVVHLLLAVAIVHQLVISLFMEMPRNGAGGDLAFVLHGYVGVFSMGAIAIFWVWVLLRRREHGIGALLPWFWKARRRALASDVARHLRFLKRLDVPAPGDATPLASAVHGLGLLAASVMAATGTAMFAVMSPDGSLPDAAKAILNLHRLFGNLMWAFLVGHAAIAVLHQAKGHSVLQRIFG